MPALLLALLHAPAEATSHFLDPSRGPAESGGFATDPWPFIALLIAGFLIGTIGHVYRSKTLIAAGILLIFAATIALPIYLAATR